MSAAAKFQLIPLASMCASKLNPRRSFDEAKHLELVESVKAHGILEPILVRENEDAYFEVVAGERRFRAAEAAGLDKVPCMVRELTDAEALEVAILENVVRHDISALDEGDAYRSLIKTHGYTVESVVEKTGRSRTVVFARMKLAELQGEARELVLSGQWSASIGELIARLPTEKAQGAAMKRLQDKAKYHIEGVGGLSYRAAKEILDEEFELQLSTATFDIKDAVSFVVDGKNCVACVDCPKRTHAPDNRAAFADVRDDTCLDEACWNKKKAISFRMLQAEMAASGKKLMKEKNLTTAHHYGSGPAPLAAAAAEKYSRPADAILGEKTWKDLLGAEVPKVVVLDEKQKTHNLVDRKAALALLEQKDPKAAAKLKEAKEAAPKEEDWETKRKAEDAKRRARMAAVRVVRTKALETVTKLDTAVELLLQSYTHTWEWANVLRAAGLPKGSKPEKLKPAERVRFLVGKALDLEGAEESVELAAKLTKLDLKALTKKAAAAVPGTCWACAKPAPKDETLCVACGGEVNE